MKKEFTVVDLTHTLSADIPYWDGSCGFDLAIDTDYKDCTPPDLFRSQKIRSNAGIGTHMDAPAHCFPDGKTIEALAMEDLVTDCVVIRVGEAAENYIIMPGAVEDFEEEYGRIHANSFVIFSTGWERHWNVSEKFINGHVFPSVDESTARLLLERNIAGLGVDTLSADTGARGFPVHRAILGAGKYLVENIANLGKVPATGAKSCALPMKILDGTEAPVRLVALLSA